MRLSRLGGRRPFQNGDGRTVGGRLGNRNPHLKRAIPVTIVARLGKSRNTQLVTEYIHVNALGKDLASTKNVKHTIRLLRGSDAVLGTNWENAHHYCI